MLKIKNSASRLRLAVLCALLLHVLVAWAMTDVHFQTSTTSTPTLLAVMLQAAPQKIPKVNAAPSKAIEPKAVPAKTVTPKAAPVEKKAVQPQPKLMTPAVQAMSETQSAPNKVLVPEQNQAPKAAEAKALAPAQIVAETGHSSKEAKDSQTEAPYTPPQYRAAHLKNPPIETPYISRKNNETGTVRLWVKVSAKGEPVAVKIEKSSGFPRLDEAAFQAVKNTWRFVPARRGDTPIESEVAFNIPFILKDAD